jgi:hypothetical protein
MPVRTCSEAPHALQNRASGGLERWQRLHFILTIPFSRPPEPTGGPF